MRISELTGAQLDYWVAKAVGYEQGLEIEDGLCLAPAMPDEVQIQGFRSGTSDIYEPSHCWEQGGPIIEREQIEVHPRSDRGRGPHWGAVPNVDAQEVWEHFQHGPTPLIAAMRAFVASKFGDEVPDQPA